MLFRRNFLFLISLSLITVLAIGFRPFVDTVDPSETLLEQANTYPEEVERLSDGTYLVSARTSMPQVNANMVRWWFAGVPLASALPLISPLFELLRVPSEVLAVLPFGDLCVRCVCMCVMCVGGCGGGMG